MSNNAASNVIPMRDPERPIPNPQEAQFERLLKECQGIALERLANSVSTMLDKAEDTLWGQAEQSYDRAVRDLYVAAKDKILAQRKYIEDQFRANYLVEFDKRTRRERKEQEDFSQFQLGSLELGLVNDDDLEETLKVNEMSAKLRRYCEEELNALDQRVGVLLGDANLQGEANPFSPHAVCNAYKQTCRQLESNLKIRMILHKLWDDHVLDDIRSIYKDLNNLLIQRAILPTIRYGMRRAAGNIGPRPGMPLAAAPGADPATAVVPPVPEAGLPGAGYPGMAGLPGVGMGLPGGGLPGAPMLGVPGAGVPGGMGGYGGPVAAGGEQDFYAMLQSLFAQGAQYPVGMSDAMDAGLSVPGGVPGAGMGGGVISVPGFPPIMGVPGGGYAGGVGVPGGGMPSVGMPGVGMPGGYPGIALGGGVPVGVAVPPRLLQGAELIGSLTRLQHGDMTAISGAPPTLTASAFTSGTTNVVRELKSTSIGSSVDQTDGMTMDIVAMLFDQIFGDKRVPHALKALIGRLQIPVVKVAVLDKKFFSKKSHPARRMLDTLGEFALGLDEKFDHTSPMYQHIEDIVQRLIDDFEDNIDIFERLHDELLTLIRDEATRAEEAAKEAARKVAYMERLEVGKAVAQREIKRRCETKRMPRLVQKLLVNEWLKLLLFAHARHGEDSSAWKSALQTMDLLIWSVDQKNTVEERRKLATMLPGLLKRLQAGLQAIGTPDEVRTKFFAKLMRMHTKVISGSSATATRKPATQPIAPAPAAAPTKPMAPAAAAAPASIEVPVLLEEVQQPLAAEATVDAAVPEGAELADPAVLLGLQPPSLTTLDFGDGPVAGPPTLEHAVPPEIEDAVARYVEDLAPSTERDLPSALDEVVAELPSLNLDGDTGPSPIERTFSNIAQHTISAQSLDALPERAPGDAVADIDDDIEAAPATPKFAKTSIKNPFGEGDIEVEEISLSDLPGLLASSPPLPPKAAPETKSADPHNESVTNLKEGDWLEFRSADDTRTQAKLSYISPIKGTYLFVNRQGGKVGEYSLYQLAREFRTGGVAVLESVPLFDRAMSSLVGVLKKSGK